MKRKLILMSGIPGVGKSTLAQENHSGAFIASADHYHMLKVKDENGVFQDVYDFKPQNIGPAHNECMASLLDAMELKLGFEQFVVDNTFIHDWEFQQYLALGTRMGMDIQVYYFKVRAIETVTDCYARCTHDVPLDVISRMAIDHIKLLPWLQKGQASGLLNLRVIQADEPEYFN